MRFLAATIVATALLATMASALSPGQTSPSNTDEADVSGVAVDYIDIGSAAYEALNNFDTFVGTSHGIVFDKESHKLMTQYMAQLLQALDNAIGEDIAVVRGFQSRPQVPTSAPSLLDVGRALRLRYKADGSASSDARLSTLAQACINAGFDFVAVPADTTTDNYVYVSTPKMDCGDAVADLLFILDGSGSVGSGNFQTMLNFAQEVVSFFDVAPDKTRVAAMVYDSSNYRKFDFDYIQSVSKQQLINYFDTFAYPDGGTETGSALSFALSSMFVTSRGARDLSEGVPRVAIVITDGKSGDDVSAPAQALRDAGVTLYAVGISGADVSELNQIASPPVEDNVVFIDTFSEFSALASKISRANCDQPASVSSDIDIEVNNTSPGDIRYYRPDLDGLTESVLIVVETTGGATDLYVSTNPNPGPFNYDYAVENDDAIKAVLVDNTGNEDYYVSVRSRSDDPADTVSYRVIITNAIFQGNASYTIYVSTDENVAGTPIFTLPPLRSFDVVPSFMFDLFGPDEDKFVLVNDSEVVLTAPLEFGKRHVVAIEGIDEANNLAGGIALNVIYNEMPWTASPDNGHEYQINYLKKLNWFDAKEACEANNAQLASVSSVQENNWLAELALNTTLGSGLHQAWLGGHFPPVFAWTDGSAATDFGFPWSVEDNDPHAHCRFNCLALKFKDKKTTPASEWKDLRCGRKRAYICKRPIAA
ncbi:hypothetical protein PTSG_10931 [Salpingoeca rosetta]|uniref:C-type lectin domain-containing protein n=1 Tax=Salpingoeca rosetta (strain ATCC 50818 / BSB-021) TaxID=946362 RepID=F2URF2_SALR5|nr:uncharacterized protein PTSG_10931 [Salpingoeca rosetta]EGD80255.1 hypothetical protein PTSG_10931 [Salpingoeca rosetta]|eukprot:XP_004988317.1 hypothetical protein PTSG_10931 [Salpingoeca rosetta]